MTRCYVALFKYVAVYCSGVLQCVVAVWCSVLISHGEWLGFMQRSSNMLQCIVAVCCSLLLQCDAVCCIVMENDSVLCSTLLCPECVYIWKPLECVYIWMPLLWLECVMQRSVASWMCLRLNASFVSWMWYYPYIWMPLSNVSTSGCLFQMCLHLNASFVSWMWYYPYIWLPLECVYMVPTFECLYQMCLHLDVSFKCVYIWMPLLCFECVCSWMSFLYLYSWLFQNGLCFSFEKEKLSLCYCNKVKRFLIAKSRGSVFLSKTKKRALIVQ